MQVLLKDLTTPQRQNWLQHAIAPTRLPGWDAGDITVQDLSAQLAAEALSPRGTTAVRFGDADA